MPTIDRNKTSLLAILLLIAASSTYLIWIMYAQQNNTLKQNGQWLSSKLNLEMYVYGRDEYFNGHPGLAFNHLNLSAWHGFQELLTVETFPIKTVDFDYFMKSNSYFYFIFNKDIDHFSSIRISTNPNFPSAYLTVTKSGEFISRLPLKIPDLKPNTWHHVHIIFDQGNKNVVFEINRQKIAVIPIDFPLNQQFGFRGSYGKVLIDNVTAKNHQSRIIFSDNFSYRDRYLIIKFIGILLGICLIYWIIYRIILMKIRNRKAAIFPTILLSFALLIVLLCIAGYLYLYKLNSYPNPDSISSKILHNLNFYQQSYSMEEKYNQELLNKYRPLAYLSNSILFIGTSQTWGAGAEKADQTFVNVVAEMIHPKSSLIANVQNINRLESALSAKTTSEIQSSVSAVLNTYQVMNAGISGLNSGILLNFYRNYWIKLHPTIVLIDLSFNDNDPTIFRNNLTEFVKLNKQHNIKTVFILEANSPEYTPGELEQHLVMKNVAQKDDIRIIDLHQYLKSKMDTGILWWDEVHLTSYGHELSGKYIYENIKDLL